MGWLHRRVEPDVVGCSPPVRRAGPLLMGQDAQLVGHGEPGIVVDAERGQVQPHGRLPGLMRIQVDDDQYGVVPDITVSAVPRNAGALGDANTYSLREAEQVGLVNVVEG